MMFFPLLQLVNVPSVAGPSAPVRLIMLLQQSTTATVPITSLPPAVPRPTAGSGTNPHSAPCSVQSDANNSFGGVVGTGSVGAGGGGLGVATGPQLMHAPGIVGRGPVSGSTAGWTAHCTQEGRIYYCK